jgi:hypothetical protein
MNEGANCVRPKKQKTGLRIKSAMTTRFARPPLRGVWILRLRLLKQTARLNDGVSDT